MEYFLAKSRNGAIMPFLVDMKIDNPVIPIPLPEGVVCSEMVAISEPTNEKVLGELKRYFSGKYSREYTDRY